MSKYLDQDGLLYFWQKLKTLFAGKVDKETGKGLSTNDYTTAEKNKLAGIDEGANNYTLPTASANELGGIKVGTNLSISNGVLSSTNTDTKVNVKAANTSKAFLLGVTTTPTTNNQALEAVSDTGVYLDTTAGKLTAGSFSGNGSALTNLNASNLSSGTVPSAQLPDVSASAKGAMTPAMLSKLNAIDEGANNYTLPAATTEDLGGVIAGSGTAVDGNGVLSVPQMTPATASTAGKAGLVPAPGAGDTASFLRGDGTWGIASTSDAKVEVMLDTTHKAYLLGTLATPGSTAQGTTAVADTGVYLDTTAGKLTAGSFAGNGSGLTSLNASNLASGTVAAARLPAATTSSQGAMTAAMVTKLAGIDEGANNYTLPAASTSTLGGVIVGSGLSVAGDGTLSAPAMSAATSTAAGKTGLVPAPAAGKQGSFLRGDGTWNTPTDSKVNVTLGTTSKAFLLGTTTTPTSTAAGVTAIADTGVYLDTTAGKLTAGSFAGNGAGITNIAAGNIATGTIDAARLPAASTSSQGAMTAAMVTKLNGIDEGANNYTLPTATSSEKGGVIIGDGVSVDSGGTISVATMGAATSSAAGTKGLVPAPGAGKQASFLRGDGTWVVPTNTDTKVNVTLATTTKAFLLGTSTTPTSTATGVTAVADSGVYLDTTAGRLTATSFSGNGANLTNLAADKIATGTIAAARLPAASSTSQGAMSADDKAKLDAFGDASTYALKSDITAMYKYKGSVASTSNLPTSGQKVGDVYNVETNGQNYAWDGTQWDSLGEIFTIETITNADIDTIMAA